MGMAKYRLFGLKTAHKMMAPYPTTSHHFYDVEIDLYEVYCNKITEYDATKGTPTTFFVRYFRAAIREFILFTWHHLNSYDMQNYREISKAIEFYEQRRIAYTPEMLATKTGMSVKIVTSTLKYVNSLIMQILMMRLISAVALLVRKNPTSTKNEKRF